MESAAHPEMKRIVESLLIFVVIAGTSLAEPQSDILGLRLIIVRTEAEAVDIRARLQAGESFDELARKHSVDSSARAGGYLGTVAIQQLRPEFQEALQGLRPGQISAITRFGREYALLQLVSEVEARRIALKAWIDAGKDPNSAALEQLWMMAVVANDSDLVEALLKEGAEANTTFGDRSTVLMGAAQTGNAEMVRSFLNAGANANATASDGTTALLAGAYAGHLQVSRILIEAGADVNARLEDGSTILMKVAQAGHTEIVRALITSGASVNAAAESGLTALMEAAYAGRLDTVRVLLDAGAQVNAALKNGSTALMAAAQAGHTEIVRALLNARADVNARADNGSTALTEAAYAGRLDVVRILLDAGSNVNAMLNDGLTGLMAAALGGHTDTVRVLLKASADANARDSKGWTPLTYGQASANSATVRALLEGGSSVSPLERKVAVGRTYVNEYYGSSKVELLELATSEFRGVLDADPENVTALEWMGAIEVLRWGDKPDLEQFRRARTFLKKSADLDPTHPERHYWIASINWRFLNYGTGASAAEYSAILDEAIQHAGKAVDLDPLYGDALLHLHLLYRKKAELAAGSSERDQFLKMADAAYQQALRARQTRGDRPARFNDQFSRPALPPPPDIGK